MTNLSFLESNLAELRKRDSGLVAALEKIRPEQVPIVRGGSAGGGVEVVDAGKRYHFSESLTDKDVRLPFHIRLVVFMGLGLGSDLFNLIPWIRKKSTIEVLVIEKDLAMFRAALATRDFSHLFTDPRYHFLVGLDRGELERRLIQYFASETDSRSVYLNAIHVIPHPTLAALDEDYYRHAETASNKALAFSVMSEGNSCADAFMGFENALNNFRTIFSVPRLSALEDGFRGIPAIVVASGPSLDEALPLLRGCENRAVVLAADSALKPLLDAGIRPHVVTAIERSEIVAEFFKKTKNLQDIQLAACPIVMKEVFEEYDGPRFLAFRDCPYFELFDAKSGSLPIGPTCGNMAFTVARRLGCRPIVLVGQDLAYASDNLRSHVKGTIYPEREQPNRLEDLQKRGFYYMKGNSGGQVLTDRFFHHAIEWYEKEIAEWGGPCINTSMTGACIAGTQLKRLEECLNSELSSQHPGIRQRMGECLAKDEGAFGRKAAEKQFPQALAAWCEWLSEIQDKNQAQIQRLKEIQNHESPARIRETIIDVEAWAVELVNRTPKFRVFLQEIVRPFVVAKEIEKNRWASMDRSGGVDPEFQRRCIDHYGAFFSEINFWIDKTKALFKQISASF